ncbi:hypothetical protein HDU89_000319 [Geranomyces variabilis]|nr:hypothetical protein HDU89_000319 [Geranomyces variabilis]
MRNKEVRIHEEFRKIFLSRRTLQGYQAATYEPKTSDVSSSQDLGPNLQETITEVSDEEGDEPGNDASDANVVDTLAAGNADAADDESENDNMITQVVQLTAIASGSGSSSAVQIPSASSMMGRSERRTIQPDRGPEQVMIM